MKLITRYNRIIHPLLILLFIISIVSSYFLIRNVLQNELDEILLRTRSRIENYISINHELPAINSFSDLHIVFEKNNITRSDSGFSSTTQYIPEQHKNHISRKLVFRTSVKNELYNVIITEPLEGTRHLTLLIVKIAIATILVVLVLLLLVNRLILSRLWQPFYQSLRIMKSFKVNSRESLNFPLTPVSEFNLMNDHFKITTTNAANEYRVLKEFSENASHEIQTPLAIIRSKVDLLLQQDNITEDQAILIASVYTAVRKLSNLSQSLLLLAKIDNQQFDHVNEIELEQKINAKILQFRELWQSSRIQLSSSLQQKSIHANTELIDILLNNILSNATRYNIPEGSISIILEQKKLEISNTGKLQALDQNRIFRRFNKGAPNDGGSGLGLSIVKQICDVSGIRPDYQYQEGWHRFSFYW